MSSSTAKLPLVAILGPTASGKSALGVWLGERLGGEVVACDSTQLYRGFAVGTAKPSAVEQQRVPHHLLDVLEPSQEATAGGYRELALAVLKDLRARQRLPVFTVGTGLYLRVLVEGLADLPQRSEELRERLRASAEEHGPERLHSVLRKLDPAAADKIAAADEQKLIRAIEVCLLARKPLSDIHKQGRSRLEGWRPLKIGLQPDREQLYSRIHARTDAMLAGGWLEEVRMLVESGVPAGAKPFDSIGYRELRDVQAGHLELDKARAMIQQATRRYAKRQMTWFRRESEVHWIAGFGDQARTQEEALAWLQSLGLQGHRGDSSAEV
jgi:tRNA dimethylallyltransferase